MKYDIIIIGSGPGGYVAGIRASQLGQKVAIIEKAELGGICLNWGCIPAKSLIKSAVTLEIIKTASDVGINVDGEIKPDFNRIIERSRDVAITMSTGVGFLMKKNNIDVIRGHGKLISSSEIEVNSEGECSIYSADNIILATGARARELPGIKIDDKNVIGYKKAMSLEKLPNSMIVIGSGAIGTELAYFYNTLGTEVTLIEYQPEIVPLEDVEVSKHLGRSLKKRGMKIKTNSAVKSIEVTDGLCRVQVEGKKGTEILEADIVLSAIGISNNIEEIGLEELGVETDRGFVTVDKYYQTNIKGIYAIGDIIKGPALAHVASAEGIICVEKIAGLDPKLLDYSCIPACTYINPEVASTGLTEKGAIDEGYNIKTGKFMFLASGKANATGAREGFVKLIFNSEDHKLLGAHIFGDNATEMLAGLIIAKSNGITAEEIIGSVHPHPTMSEAIIEAANDAIGQAIHL